mgnify:CR=1 FL=1
MDSLLLAVFDITAQIRSFMAAGGPVLVAIAGVILLMWAMSVERMLYLQRVLPRQEAQVIAAWRQRPERTSWQAHQIRRALIAHVDQDASHYLSSIKTLVMVCPLFGLMGTVTGMIAVFDVMAFSGMGNPRLMAAGVSQATIPTMAGMVVAISGLYFVSRFEQVVDRESHRLNDHLVTH